METVKLNINKFLGHLFFLVMFVMALFYWLERTSYADPAFAVFNSVVAQTFVPQAGRFGAVLPQLIPLAGIWMHVPLHTVMVLYSIAYVVLYYLVFLVIAYGMKNDRIALAVPLIVMLGISSSWFWISTETHQALVYSILFFAFLYYARDLKPGIRKTLVTIGGGTVILFLCFYTHPVTFFTTLFILGYYMVDTREWRKPAGYIMAGVIIGLTLFKVLNTPEYSYENTFFEDFLAGYEKIPELWSSHGFKFFRTYMGNLYLFPMLMFLATSAFYAYRRAYLKLGLYTGAVILFALVLFTTYNYPVFRFLMEKNLMPMMLFILLPFMHDVVLPSAPLLMNVKRILIIGAFIFTCVNVVISSTFYTERIRYVQMLIERTRKFPQKKFLLDPAYTDPNRINVPWAFGPETLILSSLDGPDSSRSIYLLTGEDTVALAQQFGYKRLFLNIPMYPEVLDAITFDKRYFHIDDSPYRMLESQDIHDPRSGGTVFVNRFTDPGFRIGSDTCRRDTSGNLHFVQTHEFGPGYDGKLADITRATTIRIHASIRFSPLEPREPKSLYLVISRENNGNVKEYYIATAADTIARSAWGILRATGVVNRTGPDDVVKVYVWNRARKAVALDDLEISYTRE